MRDKLPLLLGYALLLCASVLSAWRWPAGDARPRLVWRKLPDQRLQKWIVLALSLGLCVVLLRLGLSAPWLLVVLAGWFLLSGSRAQAVSLRGLLAAIAMSAAASLLWWTSPAKLGWLQAVLAAMLVIGLACAFNAPVRHSPRSAGAQAVVLSATLFGAALIFLQPVEAEAQWFVTWHHWGAYLGSAESVAAGLRPLQDIPLQYGLGPTLLLLPAAAGAGFAAMYWPVYLLTVLGLFVVTATCVDATSESSRPVQWCAAGAALAGSILWTAQPWDVGTTMMTPSTFALRFLPAYLLVFALTRPSLHQRLAFAAWVICLLWSVESTFYALVIYGAHQLYAIARPTPRQVVLVAGRVALQALIVFAVATVAFRVVYGVFPSPLLYVFYALNPPGVMPVNWAGPIWWFLAVVGLGLFALARGASDGPVRRRLYICVVSCVAFSSYYLGRSHDNNVLNLMPSLVMVLCCALGAIPNGVIAPVARILFATPLFLLPFFGYAGWPAPSGHDASAYDQRFAYSQSYYPDLAHALQYLKERGEGADVLTTGAINLAVQGPQGVWNALHPLTNFMFASSDRRKQVLRAGLERLDKPGWLVVDRRLAASELVQDFSQVYSLTERREFGDFIALRFAPPANAAAKKSVP